MIYIFDVDGTLTKSRNVIDPKFKTFFEYFISNNRVWLISGSDKDKTIEQLGYNIWESVERAYQCSGNQLFIKGELIRENKFNHPYVNTLLEQFLIKSKYKHQYGNHIEERPGMVNFSVVGRNCNQKQRDEYFEWDKINKEREHFVWEIVERYPWLDATIGGEISIDIYNRGEDKGQIVKDADTNFTFFGDKLKQGGNDYPVIRECITKQLKDNKFNDVKNWQETLKILKDE
jgi:phosphomannomutase